MLNALAVISFVGISGCTLITKDRAISKDNPRGKTQAKKTTRKQCTLIDWYHVAQESAAKGEDIKKTQYYNACLKMRSVNTEQLNAGIQVGTRTYCVPEAAFSHGSRGQVYNADFCAKDRQTTLEEQYAKGIVTFCDPAKMYKMAQNGFVYENQCPKPLEKNFLGEYHKGRQEYIKAEIKKNKAQIKALEAQIKAKQELIKQLVAQQNQLPKPPTTANDEANPKTQRTTAAQSNSDELTLKHKILTDQIRIANEEVESVQQDHQKLVKLLQSLEEEL